jgi:hypothetical protein
MTRQVLGRQSETGDVRFRDGEPGGIGEEWLAKREWWCYESEYSASKTKQALSRYKVVTGAITTAQDRVSTQDAARVQGNARARAYRICGLIED